MDSKNIVLIIQICALLVAIGLFVYKLKKFQDFKARHKHIGLKWIFWYTSVEILGTASPSRRNFMQVHNRLSTAMWIAVLLILILFVFPL